MQKSQKTLQQLKALKNKVEHYEGLVTKYEDILTLIEMGIEEDWTGNTTATTLVLPSTLVPAAQKPATGPTCCSVCTPNGLRKQALR